MDVLKSVLTSDDAPNAVRALINDAGTYDLATGTGGFNGSLRLECALPLPEGRLSAARPPVRRAQARALSPLPDTVCSATCGGTKY